MAIELDYPLTRSFPGRWFGPLSVCGAFIVFVFLAIINVVLVGYDTVAVFKDDYNARDTHWFDDFMPSRAKEDRCDAAFFNPGDTVRTNVSLFEWRVESIKNANAATGVTYKREALAGCDLSSVFMNAVLSTWTLEVTALVTCKIIDNTEVTIKTSFATSALPGRYDSYVSDASSTHLLALRAVDEAGNDIGIAAMESFVRNPVTAPVVISTQMDLPFCPPNSDPNAACFQGPPKFVVEATTMVYDNNTFTRNDGPLAAQMLSDAGYLPIWANFAQALYAVVRIDLGNNHTNNFLLNPSVVDETLAPTFAPLDINSTLALRRFLENPTIVGEGFSLPISSNFGPSHIRTTYLCKFERLKQPGSLFMAILVATLSTFSGAWTVYLTAATIMLKKRGEKWNRCGGHADYDKVPSHSPVPAPKFPMPRGEPSYKSEYEQPITA